MISRDRLVAEDASLEVWLVVWDEDPCDRLLLPLLL